MTEFWLSLPGSDGDEITTTKEDIPIVDRSADLQFSMSFFVDNADTEVSAWLKLTTPAGNAIRYLMAIPERIVEPGNYSISVIVPGQELGCSLFRVTMMILIGAKSRETPEQLQSEGSIVVDRPRGGEGMAAPLTGASCAMELEQHCSVQYVDHQDAEQ